MCSLHPHPIGRRGPDPTTAGRQLNLSKSSHRYSSCLQSPNFQSLLPRPRGSLLRTRPPCPSCHRCEQLEPIRRPARAHPPSYSLLTPQCTHQQTARLSSPLVTRCTRRCITRARRDLLTKRAGLGSNHSERTPHRQRLLVMLPAHPPRLLRLRPRATRLR